MTMDATNTVLIVLIVPPTLKDAFVDWLLTRDEKTGFTSFPVAGHGRQHDGLSIAEQVTGRQQRQQFQVVLSADGIDEFIGEARREFGAIGIRYWVIPLLAGGRIDGDLT